MRNKNPKTGLQDRRSWPFFGRKEKRQEKTHSSAAAFLPTQAKTNNSPNRNQTTNRLTIKTTLKDAYKYILTRQVISHE
jgi:hypothetical protein